MNERETSSNRKPPKQIKRKKKQYESEKSIAKPW